MNTFKKKSLHVAVLAGLGAITAAGTANAVHINPDGLGQVLIYPYYTARAGQFTAISVVNTTSQTKSVKVRFLEGRDSREVLDFNLWMSPTDVWTGAVVSTPNGAKIISNDNSCVTPSDLFAEARSDAGQLINEFKNYQYISGGYEDRGTSLDRTREGYFEVIEMGVVTNTTYTGYVKHTGAGVPANCGAMDPLDGTPALVAAITAPTGGLGGRASVISSGTGANYTFEPTALDQWSTLSQYTITGSTLPNLSAATPAISNVFTNGGVVQANWGGTGGRDAVSAPMIRDTLMNEFILDLGTRSSTDWVVTMPTRRLYVTPTAAETPFSISYAGCEPYNLSIYNREEGPTAQGPGLPLPSPRPVTQVSDNRLCYEATIVPFQAASLLGSINVSPLLPGVLATATNATTTAGATATPSIRGPQGANGWMLMSFNLLTGVTPRPAVVPVSATGSLTPGALPVALPAGAGRHIGLPIVGAMVNNYQNSVTSQYASTIGHKYTRNILLVP
jgi:hypothetical protein